MNERSIFFPQHSPQGANATGHSRPRLALVGTYPPTRCGIASFTASLRAALLEAGASRADVARVLERGDKPEPRQEVVSVFEPDEPAQVGRTADVLSAYDMVVLQHEFGIYGPRSGRAAVDLLERVTAPVVVTLHTVSDQLSEEKQRILAALADRAEFTVVLSETAGRLLISRYGADPSRVQVILHGAEAAEEDIEVRPLDVGVGPLLLTWGLIGPGKGLDWALGALPRVKETMPDVRWVIAGQTHPKVVARQGERYRRMLERTITSLGLEDNVVLLDEYLSRGHIHRLLQEAAAVVLPYDSTDQTSSGVLVEAVASGVPVVATSFPQAAEMAERGAALVVPHRDADALAGTLVRLLSDPIAVTRLVAAQTSLAPQTDWPDVGARYLGLAERFATQIAS